MLKNDRLRPKAVNGYAANYIAALGVIDINQAVRRDDLALSNAVEALRK